MAETLTPQLKPLQIKPQEGFQEAFLSSAADIVIGGGAAGAGKSWVLLLEPIRHTHVPGFGGVIFRRITPQITNEGGLWDTAMQLYPHAGGVPKESRLTWEFPAGPKIKFAHMEYETNKLDWQGTQIPYIGFDELTHFTRSQFFYLVGRNRSVCGVKPYIRATCNPDPDSWVAEFIAWWIDQDTGFPIPERAGVIRYFTSDKGKPVWGDTAEEVIEKCPHIFNADEFASTDKRDLIKSVTFIPGTIYGNRELLSKNPQYLGNLLSLDEAEQMQLLKGNWKITQDGSALFDYARVNDLFSNFVEASKDRYITCDYARFGQDLTVIKTWKGWEVERIEVMTKSSTVDAYQAIEAERQRAMVPISNVVVDDDGVGGGVTDQSGGQYRSFHGGAVAMPNPLQERDAIQDKLVKENYANLKTQCYYRLAQKVNAAEVAIRLESVIVDGVATNEVLVGGERQDVRSLISKDLRAIKKKDMDKDGKKQINPKEEQKNILGRSPDFGDSLMMRAVFDLEPALQPVFGYVG